MTENKRARQWQAAGKVGECYGCGAQKSLNSWSVCSKCFNLGSADYSGAVEEFKEQITDLQSKLHALESELKQKNESGCCIVEHSYRMAAEHKSEALEAKLKKCVEQRNELVMHFIAKATGISATDQGNVIQAMDLEISALTNSKESK